MSTLPTRAQRAALRHHFTEVETAVSLAVSALADMRAALDGIDPRVLAEGRPAVRRAAGKTTANPDLQFDLNGTAPRRGGYTRGSVKGAKVTVSGPVRGAVAESERRAIVAEVSAVLRAQTGTAVRTSVLALTSPTLRRRYSTDARRAAALYAILASMGERFAVRNVSTNTRARWAYVGQGASAS